MCLKKMSIASQDQVHCPKLKLGMEFSRGLLNISYMTKPWKIHENLYKSQGVH